MFGVHTRHIQHLAILKSSDIKELPLNRVQAILFEQNFTKKTGGGFGSFEMVRKLFDAVLTRLIFFTLLTMPAL